MENDSFDNDCNVYESISNSDYAYVYSIDSLGTSALKWQLMF